MALLALAVAVALAWNLQQVRLLYWDLMGTSKGPEAHGRTTYRVVPSGTPFDQWLERARSRIPVFEGLFIDDVATVGLGPWPEMGAGVHGLYLRFAGYQIMDGRILELPAGGRTEPLRHMFEMDIYFLGGPGHTLFYRNGAEPLRVDWQEGSLLAVPLNVRYQHFNDSAEPVRLLAATGFPFALNTVASEDYLFNSRFDFVDRFDGRESYFQGATPHADEKRLVANFVPDVRAVPLAGNPERGAGTETFRWAMAGQSVLDVHASAMPPRQHMRAHRHSSDAFLLILSGSGYSLVWPGDDVAGRQRINWKKGTLFVPPTYWYHQHFNVSAQPSRQLAINAAPIVRNLGLRFMDERQANPPEVQAEWETALRSGEAATP
jgi:uncharacterized RmlC-like cupin family protein